MMKIQYLMTTGRNWLFLFISPRSLCFVSFVSHSNGMSMPLTCAGNGEPITLRSIAAQRNIVIKELCISRIEENCAKYSPHANPSVLALINVEHFSQYHRQEFDMNHPIEHALSTRILAVLVYRRLTYTLYLY